MRISHSEIFLHEANIRSAFDSMRWMENVDEEFGHLFQQDRRPDYVGSHPDKKPLDARHRDWMIEIKSREADPHNKLVDFEDRGTLSRRDFIRLKVHGYFKGRLALADEQLQTGCDVINPRAKGVVIFINQAFQSLRREAAVEVVSSILWDPASRLRATHLVVYIQEACDWDPDPEHRPVHMWKIWAKRPDHWDERYANFLVDFGLGSILTFAGRPCPTPNRVRVMRDGRVVNLSPDARAKLLRARAPRSPSGPEE